MRFVAIVLILMAAGCATPPAPPSNRIGVVPNEDTAIRIAEAVLTPIYGSQHVKAERPYKATLNADVWEVRGTTIKPEASHRNRIGMKKRLV